jgi:hypothetical protein
VNNLTLFHTFRPRAAKSAKSYGNAGICIWCETRYPMEAFKSSFVPSFHKNMAAAIDDNLAENIAERVVGRLVSKYRITNTATRIRSNRLEYMRGLLKSKQDIKVYSSKSSYQIGVGNIGLLDRKLLISSLDRKFPLRHNADGYPKKAKAETGILYHLWRILEVPRKGSYRISATGFGKKKKRGRPKKIVPIRSKNGEQSIQEKKTKPNYLHFTMAKNVWRTHMSVQWKARRAPSSSAYWFLDARREVYKADRDIFKGHVMKAIVNTIKSSPYFSKQGI